MNNRIMSNCKEKTFSYVCMPESVALDPEDLEKEGDHCVVVCKKLMPNVYFIKSGLLFIDEYQGFDTAELRSVTCPTKIVFITSSDKSV